MPAQSFAEVLHRQSPHLYRSSSAAGAGQAQDRSYSEGPANRLPDHQETLQPLYPGNGGAGLRLPQGKVPQGGGNASGQFGAGQASNITYAVGWTQHTVGVQIIRATGMLQALLGNIGRPGGGVLALEENKIDIGTLLTHNTAGERLNVESTARDLHLDPGLLWTLAQSALKPALHAWRRQLAPIGEGAHWEKGYCFICGAHATLGELQENAQALHLRCGQCGPDWQFRRLRCIWCGNEDHGRLSCLYSEDQLKKMRVEACDRCHGYLKVIASFFPTPPEMLPVEDLATLHLDYIAQEHGYERSGGDMIKQGKYHAGPGAGGSA